MKILNENQGIFLNEYDHYYKEDLVNLYRLQMALLKEENVVASLEECANIWQRYSSDLCASWLFFPDKDDDILKQIKSSDFAEFDLILALDKQNLSDLQRHCPAEHAPKLQLLMRYHPDYPTLTEVPDPYYGSQKGFEVVLEMIEQSCLGLLRHLKGG